jgi:hypothetical protein
MVMKVRDCSRPLLSLKYVWRVLGIGFDISGVDITLNSTWFYLGALSYMTEIQHT